MIGHGERPAERREEDAEGRVNVPGVGTTVYDEHGTKLGTIRGVDEGGFFVSTRAGMEELSVDHARSGHGFGEAHLMWRCMECGEMGAIDDGMPGRCPSCGTGTEDIMWWTED